MRFYRIPHSTKGNIYVPSVTTILGRTASEKSKRSLENWCANNPGLKEEACLRGSTVHECCERYLRNLPVNCPEKYSRFWNGIENHLAKYSEVLWSERPMRPEWRPITVAADGMPRIWHEDLCFSGTPDLVGIQSGLTVLADYKTSNGPYCRNFPKDSTDRQKFTGYMKYQKVGMQLAAYSLAFEATLGVHIDCCQVIVSTEDITQSFFIRGREFEAFKNKWTERVHLFWDLMAKEDAAIARTAEQSFPNYQPTQRELVAA
jgi:hypothetical protein